MRMKNYRWQYGRRKKWQSKDVQKYRDNRLGSVMGGRRWQERGGVWLSQPLPSPSVSDCQEIDMDHIAVCIVVFACVCKRERERGTEERREGGREGRTSSYLQIQFISSKVVLFHFTFEAYCMQTVYMYTLPIAVERLSPPLTLSSPPTQPLALSI